MKVDFILGDTARDRVTRFTGFITAKTEHIDGRVTYYLEPPSKIGSNSPEGKWVDSTRMEKTHWTWELWEHLRVIPR